jgi:hypothetical protein
MAFALKNNVEFRDRSLCAKYANYVTHCGVLYSYNRISVFLQPVVQPPPGRILTIAKLA